MGCAASGTLCRRHLRRRSQERALHRRIPDLPPPEAILSPRTPSTTGATRRSPIPSPSRSETGSRETSSQTKMAARRVIARRMMAVRTEPTKTAMGKATTVVLRPEPTKTAMERVPPKAVAAEATEGTTPLPSLRSPSLRDSGCASEGADELEVSDRAAGRGLTKLGLAPTEQGKATELEGSEAPGRRHQHTRCECGR